MQRDIRQLRNIGIIAHIDAGKTTITERMLYYSGAKHRVGEVDKGTTETDCDPEEQERGITIYSACVTFPWRGCIINLLDTPGHVDFTAEVERCLRVLDGAVVVFSAREGVEAQSETVWRQADRYHIPRIVFINKLDREGADFEGTFQQIQSRLDANPVAIQIPMGLGPAHQVDPFTGVIDLIDMQLLTFHPERDGKDVQRQPVPDSQMDRAQLWREQLIESLCDYNDEMMEHALQEKEVPAALIRRVLREATLLHQVQPVLCGSALHGIGVQPVLDAVEWYLPNPADMPPVEGFSLDKGKGSKGTDDRRERRRPTNEDPFCGLVFKVLPAKTGDFCWIRVYSGVLKANSRALNTTRDVKENIAQLWHIHATRKEREGQVEEVGAGDIVGVIGPRASMTGDTLCDTKAPLLLDSIEFPDTVIAMAIEPESTADRKKLSEVLDMMKRQDPTFHAAENEETGQTLISGMGELHLEVIKHRLLRDFKLNVRVHKPRVNYRETIAHAVDVVGECQRHLGGEQLFARLQVRFEPWEDEAGVRVISRCPPEIISGEFLMAAIEECQGRGDGGGLIGGFPLSKLRVTITGGEAHPVHSNATAFRIAAADAFEKGLRAGGPVLLEPIMKLDISTPDEHFGDFVGDLQQRRGVIVKTDARGSTTFIEAQAPLAELFGYSNAMRSLSQGRAGCSMQPLHYAPAPQDVLHTFGV